MNGVDIAWRIGRLTITPSVHVFGRLRSYGTERIPRFGGAVLALNHFSWIDTTAFGSSCPRTVYYMAKIEAHQALGLGQLMRAFGTFPVRRGESDRGAGRMMRQIVRDGRLLRLFVEGARPR